MQERHAVHLERVKALGTTLEKRREELGISQSEMARLTGIGQSQLSRIEGGAYERDLGTRYLPLLAEGYRVPLRTLLSLLFVEHDLGTTADEVVRVELKPNTMFTAGVERIGEQVAAQLAAMQSRVGELEDAVHALQSEQASGQTVLHGQLEEIRDSVAVIANAARDFAIVREQLAQLGHGVPEPRPLGSRSAASEGTSKDSSDT